MPEFLFPEILRARDVISGFLFRGKEVRKTGRGSEVKKKAIFGFKNYHWLKSLYIFFTYLQFFVRFTRDKTSAIII